MSKETTPLDRETQIISLIIIKLFIGIILILLVLILMSSCQNSQQKTPIEWCIEEIHTYENYNCEWSYTYNQVHNADKSAECYVVTCYTEDRVGEWFCYYKVEDNTRYVDCDLIKEELL